MTHHYPIVLLEPPLYAVTRLPEGTYVVLGASPRGVPHPVLATALSTEGLRAALELLECARAIHMSEI